ncbi:MAG: DUF3224 domain-containing protein [Acidimicrobiia bacterium]
MWSGASPPGSFVLELNGTFDGATLAADWFVVPGSAMGQLRGLQGEGGFAARSGEPRRSTSTTSSSSAHAVVVAGAEQRM